MKPIQYFCHGVPVEESAKQQLQNVASMPFIHHHIAVMPDVHFGMGATIGSVIPTIGAIIPAAVGVDIGCGMMVIRTEIKAKDLPDNLQSLRFAIEKSVPHGRTDNGGKNDRGAWHAVPTLSSSRKGEQMALADCLKNILTKHPDLNRWTVERAMRHLGTLGTGNHFIELCLDEDQYLWIMLHSGSRGIGNAIGNYFINIAKQEMERWFIHLPDKDLSYLSEGSHYFNDYIEAVAWAQIYAETNRKVMMEIVINVLKQFFPRHQFNELELSEYAVHCHHNYVRQEIHFGKCVYLTRKGAVSAYKDELGIIPGSMGAKSFIVRGKGNRESFHSCSHGAGRIMSRTAARKSISLEQHIKDTEGVECRKDESVIDETPSAYKDIDAIMAAQSDLIDIVHTLKQVLCVKG